MSGTPNLLPWNGMCLLSPRDAFILDCLHETAGVRGSVRGDDEVARTAGGILASIHALALKYVESRTTCALPPSADDGDPQVSGRLLRTGEVAAMVGLKHGESVRLAASKGQLRGTKNEAGWWQFEKVDVIAWRESVRSNTNGRTHTD